MLSWALREEGTESFKEAETKPQPQRPSRDEEVGDIPGNVCRERLRQMQVVDPGDLDTVLDRSWAG